MDISGRNNIDFLHSLTNDVRLNNVLLNSVTNQSLQEFLKSGELRSIGDTICSTIHLIMPYLWNIENRLYTLENIPTCNILEALPHKEKPPSPKYPPPKRRRRKRPFTR